MAASAVPVRRMIVEEWWFRLIVRAVLALVALWAVHIAAGRFTVFQRDFSTNLNEVGVPEWLAWLGSMAAAGFLFGLAAWLPFGKVRCLWSRLLLAGLALAPLVQFWWVYVFQLGRHHAPGGFISRHVWFADWVSETGLAILVGVAIASGFRAARSAPDGE